MTKQHAKLSASASRRWIACPASVQECEGMHRIESSEASERGTKIHEVAESMLNNEETSETQQDIIDAANEFKEYVQSFGFEELHVETQVYVSDECWGTADVIGVKNDELYIVDLKSGTFPVFAEENSQLMIYAVGALKKFYPNKVFKNIHLIIFQPTIKNFDEFVITQRELLDWSKHVLSPAIKAALSNEASYNVGLHCKFCDARKVCEYRNSTLYKTAIDMQRKYNAVKQTERIALIDSIMDKHDELAKFLKDVKEAAYFMLQSGVELQSVQLAPGRRARTIDDETKFITEMQQQGRDLTEFMNLKSVAQLEKIISKELLQFYTREYNLADVIKKKSKKQ